MWCGLSRATTGTANVGSRTITWACASGGAVGVTHADASGAPVNYLVVTVTTAIPYAGSRVWWSCPACARRVGMLYLPNDRDRLACRVCCGLGYASQYPRASCKRGRKASVPVFTLTTTVEQFRGGRWTRESRVRAFPCGRVGEAPT